MATATAVATVVDKWDDGQRFHVFGSLDFDTGDYTANGVPFSFAALIPGQRTETTVVAHLTGKAGYIYEWDRANKKIKIRQCAAAANPAAELSAAQLPAAVSTDVIDFYVILKKFQ